MTGYALVRPVEKGCLELSLLHQGLGKLVLLLLVHLVKILRANVGPI
jgi:hypothetical protein